MYLIRKSEGIQCYTKDMNIVPVWKTRGKYRKVMKRGYSRILYNQRNKDETIVSVIKRLFREHIIQINTNEEQRIEFQMYYIQYS